jgi:hypothetical protein
MTTCVHNAGYMGQANSEGNEAKFCLNHLPDLKQEIDTCPTGLW